jgi:hypothetical protein
MDNTAWKAGSDLRLVGYLRSVQDRLNILANATLRREEARLRALEQILKHRRGPNG